MIDGREASNKFEHLDASEEIFQSQVIIPTQNLSLIFIVPLVGH